MTVNNDCMPKYHPPQNLPPAQADAIPALPGGENTYHAELYSKLWGSYESFYGLGQHQAGVWNYRGEAVDLSQDNTNISIPFLSPATATESSGITLHAVDSTIVS